jgi:hypothetical protein
MPHLPPYQQPLAEIRRAEEATAKRAQEYRKHQEEQERRRREQRGRDLIAVSARQGQLHKPEALTRGRGARTGAGTPAQLDEKENHR